MSIKIDLKIFLFILLFWLTKQLEMYAILMLFACIHEFAHLLCGLALKFKPESIKITPFGLQINFYIPTKLYSSKTEKEFCIKKMLIAIVGPASNLAIAFFSFFISKYSSYNLTMVVYANLLLAIFNLIPIYPLDGGRILKQIIEIKNDKQTSYKIVNTTGKVTLIILTIITSILILLVHNIAMVAILLYLWYVVIQNEKNYQMRKNMDKKVKQIEYLLRKQ